MCSTRVLSFMRLTTSEIVPVARAALNGLRSVRVWPEWAACLTDSSSHGISHGFDELIAEGLAIVWNRERMAIASTSAPRPKSSALAGAAS
jgi:hypothetical protein